MYEGISFFTENIMPITKLNQFILFSEIIAAYCANHSKMCLQSMYKIRILVFFCFMVLSVIQCMWFR